MKYSRQARAFARQVIGVLLEDGYALTATLALYIHTLVIVK